MSAAQTRAGLSKSTSEDAEAHYPLKQDGKDLRYLQPAILAQGMKDAMVRKEAKDGGDTQDGGAVQPPAAPCYSVVNGSHPTHIARQSEQLLPSLTSAESRINSSDSGNSHDSDRTSEVNGDHEHQKEKAHRRKGLPSPLDHCETGANGIGLLLSPASTNMKLSQIPEETSKRRSSQVDSPAMQGLEKEKILKLSPAQIQELTSSPKSLPPLTAPEELAKSPTDLSTGFSLATHRAPVRTSSDVSDETGGLQHAQSRRRADSAVISSSTFRISDSRGTVPLLPAADTASSTSISPRTGALSRTVSTPTNLRRKHPAMKQNGTVTSSTPQSKPNRTSPAPLQLDDSKTTLKPSAIPDPMPSPMPMSIPLPPLSIPTYLQLELSSDRPSPLYIHRSVTSDFPYESSRVKLDRLQNFLLLPPQLELVLWFGALACLDAWLYSFTILPLRFLKALYILGQSWGRNLALELHFVSRIIFAGTGRMWRRRKGKDDPTFTEPPTPPIEQPESRRTSSSNSTTQKPPVGSDNASPKHSHPDTERKHRRGSAFKHRRTKSTPSALMPDHKADILKGLLVLFSCTILMYFDASRMYHSIRGQAAIKLYVIYNVLEVSILRFLLQAKTDSTIQVCDRLFSALGQDVFECLFSKESLERKPDGRSKILRPFWLFVLALFYNVVHATALFYQVITLNVAVNSYSNALLTLLMSNQFVEIKSTVFKKFEKENLFQLTCADVVERFQLWLMLIIIASRNIVETGGLTITLGGFGSSLGSVVGQGANASLPLKTSSILPKSFTIFPKWTGQVMGPFLLVLGSEMLVDWLKHAYITKFNNTKPAIYGRFLDVLAKDYYSNVSKRGHGSPKLDDR